MPAPAAERTADRPVSGLARAVALFSVYALASPLFAGWFFNRFGAGWRMQLVVEAFSLGLALVLAVAASGLSAGVQEAPRARLRFDAGLRVALQSLALLGVVALALRIVDPGYDEQEVGMRSLENPATIVAFLVSLPFAVAAEEIVFRSCQRLLRRSLGSSPSVVAVALAFAGYHWAPGVSFDSHEAETLLVTLAGGFVLAMAYERAGSIPLLVGVHLAYNILALLQTWLNLADAAMGEAGLFFAWIAGGGALAWCLRRSRAASDARPAGDALPSPAGPLHPITAWSVAVVFGGVLPILLAWIRYRSRS